MATKFLDKEGKKISGQTHSQLMGDPTYRVIRRCENHLACVELYWHGSFDKACPDEFCNQLRISFSNKVGNMWRMEPSNPLLQFKRMDKALEAMNNLLKEKPFDNGFVVSWGAGEDASSDDLEDFGEVEVPKDLPRTKSRKTGAW